MAGHTFFGKQRLCYTEVSDFTDYQGIGHDPLYKRFDSVLSVVKKVVPADLQHFLATPDYLDDEDQICWHVDKWTEHPTRLGDLSGAERAKYEAVLRNTLEAYQSSVNDLSGEDLQIMAGAIKYVDEDRVYCGDGKVYLVAWGMTPDVRQHKVVGSVIHEFEYVRKYKVTFDAGEHGSVPKLDKSVNLAEGSVLTQQDVPTVDVAEGWEFIGWSPSPIGQAVNSDMVFTAQYAELVPEEPAVPIAFPIDAEPEDDFPDDDPVEEEEDFTPQPEKPLPWYKRWWLWLVGLWKGKGCLKWLLWLLVFLLLSWLLSWLLRGCIGCNGHRAPVNGVVPIDSVMRSDGRRIDDNGIARPVTGSDGRLPDDNVIVAPVMGEGGEEPPVVEQPGAPNVMANRLFLFMEDENGDVEALARDFKKAYPDDRYGIIGYDKEVRLLVVQIPENERDQVRKAINGKLPNHKFIVVDDGIQASHPMFKGRIVDAYNVFTQDNSLSLGKGHGTHTAGLAAGSAEFFSKGASGVAPNCQLMPIQVFDNGRCPLSALIAGVMYAIHHGADVVNISVAPSFKGLNVLPVEQQAEIAKTQFHNVASLWARVCKLAAKKNAILVFAAGNDDILTSIPPENRNALSIVVTAVDERLYPTSFTNYGPCSDISAPGKAICSSFPDHTFQSFDGTSMAAPIVAGTIALMKSLKKDITVAQVRNVLHKTGADVHGNVPPMVLVDRALQAVRSGDFGVGPDTPSPPRQTGEEGYDAIRRKIAEHKQKIAELERLLPNNTDKQK